MTAWSSRSFLACLLLLAACPGDPAPLPADGSSTGDGETTGPGPGTTPQPTTLDSSGSDTTAGSTSGSTSTGPDDTTGGSTSTGPDDTSSSSSTGPDDTTGGSSSSGEASTTGDPSTTSSSSGDPTTTGGDPCAAGDGPDFAVTNNGFTDYVIDGVNDPGLVVVRGCSYTFDVNAPGHPFLLKTVQGSGAGNAYNDGVVNNGTQSGVITWDVSLAAPDALFYNCQFHPGMTGTITVIDPM